MTGDVTGIGDETRLAAASSVRDRGRSSATSTDRDREAADRQRVLTEALECIIEALVPLLVHRVLSEVGAAPVFGGMLTPEHAAEFLDCSRRRVYDLVESGRLPARRDGRRVLIARRSLEAYLRLGGGS